MERHGSSGLGAVVLLLALAAMIAPGRCGSNGKHHRKIIIHVPYYVKNHHHTHTVYKYIGGHHGAKDDAEGGASLEQPQADGVEVGEQHEDDNAEGGDDRHGRFHHLLEHEHRLVREEDGQLHRQEHRDGHLHNHHHHHHHHEQPDEERGHAHFHTTFVVEGNDGHLQETESSESSEFLGHHRDHTPFDGPNVHHHHGAYESQRDNHSEDQRSQEENYSESQPQDNILSQEQQTEESRHHIIPSSHSDWLESSSQNNNHKEKYAPRGNGKPRGTKSRWIEEKPRRPRYEVVEHKHKTSRDKRQHQDQPLDHLPAGYRKHDFNWRR